MAGNKITITKHICKKEDNKRYKYICYPVSAVWVKSGKFGWTAKFRQPACLFHILIIGIKNKLTKQPMKILSRLI